jgi:hypothetical protein
VGIEGLVWWVKNQPLAVPLVTTGPAAEGANAGGLGMPGTAALTAPLDLGTDTGLRLFVGSWLDSAHSLGFDAGFFYLARATAGFGAFDPSGAGLLVINEPVAGAPYLTQVSAPGLATGGVAVNARTDFGGADINLLWNVVRTPAWTVNLLGGFRYLELDESLDIHSNSTLFVTTTFTDNFGNLLATAPPGSGLAVGDHFGTHNYFYGGQLGVQFERRLGPWSLGGVAKLAVGATREVVAVSGVTVVSPVNDVPVVLAGGNFASIQSGRYGADRLALAPEVEVGVGYQVGAHLRVSLGYDFMYLSGVVRPGDQIDNAYDGVVHPLVPMARSSFWATGLSAGFQLGF